MRITQNQRSSKFTITNLTNDDLRQLWVDSKSESFKSLIRLALIESEDSELIREEYGLSVEDFIDNYLN